MAGVLANPVNILGAEVTHRNTTRYTPRDSDVGNHSAYAGNVTEIDIYSTAVTQSWQGYFGNVTGVLTLSDSARHVMYNWSVVSPRGQLYSSTNGTGIVWNYLQCFNYTAAGNFSDDTAQRGNTSLYGLNITQLQSRFTINSSGFNTTHPIYSSRDVDAVDHTFVYIGAGAVAGQSQGRGHRQFYANYLVFEEGKCWTSRIYGEDGSQDENEFEEVLLYEPQSASLIFTALLNEDLDGFDGRTHDFQMMVLEDGHGTNVDTTTYYFYLEIE